MAAAVIVLILLLPSPSMALKIGVVHRAPYRSAMTGVANSTIQKTNCSSEYFRVKPSVNATLGEVFIASGAIASCPSVASVSVTAMGWFLGPLFYAKSSRPYTINYSWHVAYSSAGWSTCAQPPNVYANGSMLIFRSLFDNTSKVWVVPTVYYTVHAFSFPRWNDHQHSVGMFISLTTNLTAGHHYLLYSGLETSVTARGCYSSTGVAGSDGAVVDVGSDYHHVHRFAKLTSISVS